jgi:hypothetical protein
MPNILPEITGRIRAAAATVTSAMLTSQLECGYTSMCGLLAVLSPCICELLAVGTWNLCM